MPSLILLLAACASASPAQTHSPSSTPTLSSPPPIAIESAELEQIAIDIAEVVFLSPGPESRVTSPIQLTARLAPGHQGRVRVQLIDSGGRLLAAQVLVLTPGDDLRTEIGFEISRPTLAARLVVSTEDESGRTQALNSVDLTLLANGSADILPATQQPYIVIEQPSEGDSAAAGNLVISGKSFSQPGRPLTVELITRAGKVLAFKEVYPIFSDSNIAGSFSVEFDLDLKEATWVQLAIWENGGGFPGPAHFRGTEVLLTPQ